MFDWGIETIFWSYVILMQSKRLEVPGSGGLVAGFDDLEGLFQPK